MHGFAILPIGIDEGEWRFVKGDEEGEWEKSWRDGVILLNTEDMP
jgi:hypothetical protein